MFSGRSISGLLTRRKAQRVAARQGAGLGEEDMTS
jgi:hypothetical protein